MARKSRKNTGNSSEIMIASKKVFQAALYVRISVENEQKIEADSIGTQIQMLKDFVSQMPEIQVYDIYCDNDITGTTFVRPEFSRMMNDVRDHRINCIIVKDLSRLGRNYLESGEYLEKVFLFFELWFIAINDRIDILERPVDISAQLKNMVNGMYSKDISVKVKSARKTRERRGEYLNGVAFYSYRRDPADRHHLLVDEEVRWVIKAIFTMCAQGMSTTEIARRLNEQGFLCDGIWGRWRNRGLRRIKGDEKGTVKDGRDGKAI